MRRKEGNPEVQQKKPVKPAHKLLQTVSTVLLILCTVICFVVVISAAVNQNASLFGFRLFYVVSGSMEPDYPVGSMLVVGESQELRVGDVITFYSKEEGIEGYPNTHRIVGIEEENGRRGFRTQGDANSVADEHLVLPEDVIGKVYTCINIGFLKDLMALLATPAGFFTVILLPILGVAVICMRDVKRAMSEELRRAALAALQEEQAKEEERSEDEDNTTDTTE